MSDLTSAFQAELQKERVLLFGAIAFNFPSANVYLLDGSGRLTFESLTFTGKDAVFGTLGTIEPLEDGTGDEAPALSVSLNPASDASATALSQAAMQGSRVRMWFGAVNPTTGAVIADPELLFDGEVDISTLRVGQNSLSVEYECVSSFERLFDVEEGQRLTDSFHQSIWPGEMGLSNLTGIQKTIYWGAEEPPPQVQRVDRATFNGRPIPDMSQYVRSIRY